ncbi:MULTISPECIES: hypothetical protein [Pantoea]|uniref:Uncharacterized protein n=1 Tax=Candidatus Pantoea gossypiicola TaxID=2608008 RepID=A0AB34CIX3_9GAMM|nr:MULTISPECIES: hypothetical protein [Pantoea]KAA5931178.1 hypothetical protein F3I58_18070 [Pantoea sp. VH_4]KAA5948463.1 hypothetical protein F3I55_23685 [Pantoea sp. VH_24]KAA5951712.1 hypothetical protein F3I53_23970 [Pantoea sp. VH_16]KAA5957864.1 hypothetical protein F3I54_23745 [Pantoea sp. VH_18]KAA5982763.1 hypothetical protein F3I49_17525 [Pantoea sp. M_4]
MNCKDHLKIVIASDVDYENLIAEIYRDDEFIALLQQEDGINDIKIEFSSDVSPMNFDWLQNALNEAKRRLLEQ